jgi:hypothetical protein
MEREYFAVRKNIKTKDKKYLDAKRSLNNYVNQLKFHYNLCDKELSTMIKELYEAQSNDKGFSKKWWQIWK